MPESLASLLPHAVAAVAVGYLAWRSGRSWWRKRTGTGPLCGGGCPSCEAAPPAASSAADATTPPPSSSTASGGSAPVGLRIDRRRA